MKLTKILFPSFTTRAPLRPFRMMPVRGYAAAKNVCESVPSFPFKRPSEGKPPAEYKEMLEKCPVAKVKLWDGTTPYLVTSHKLVCDIVADPRWSKNRKLPNFPEMGPGGKEAAKMRPTFVDLDPPEHTRQRGWVEWAMDKSYIDKLRPKIQQAVEEALKDMTSKPQPVDLMLTFAADVPMYVICDMMGIPRKDIPFISKSTGVRSSGSSTATEASQASKDLLAYLDRFVDEKAKEPLKKDEIISRMVHEHMGKDATKEDCVATSFLMLVAGNATVTSMIGLGVVELTRHPDQLKALQADPSLIKGAVEELCRYHTASAYAMRRVAMEDIELDGHKFKKGDAVICSNQAANRDPKVFKNPDTFDIRRNPNPQIGFGYGIHVCVSEWLARAEMEIALSTLFKHLPNLKLNVKHEDIKWSDPDRDVGLRELPIKW